MPDNHTITADNNIPISVIAVRASLDRMMESAFIRDCLLGGLNRPWRFVPVESGRKIPLVGNSLYLSLFDELGPVIRAAIAAGHTNVGAFHMGDELGQCDHAWYPDVDYVIRNYWYPDAFRLPPGARCRKVLWVPNGYRLGIGPRARKALVPTSQRTTPLFFAGFLSPSPQAQAERQNMLDILRSSALPAITLVTDSFGRGLGPAAYGAWLENTRYAPVPRGRAPETIRLYDALELGAIPISLRHAFLDASETFAPAPIVILDSWNDLPAWYAHAAVQSPAQLDALQRQILDWWSVCKSRFQREVSTLIEQSFAAQPPAKYLGPEAAF
jgi:hypothetical protein